MQLRICFDQLVIDNIITIKHLQRKCQANTVHVEGMSDLFAHILQLPVLQTTYTMSLGMSPGPVATCELDPFSSKIDYFHTLCREGKLYPLDIKQWSVRFEVFLQLFILLQKPDLIVMILITHFKLLLYKIEYFSNSCLKINFTFVLFIFIQSD